MAHSLLYCFSLWWALFLQGFILTVSVEETDQTSGQRPLKMICYYETWARTRPSPMNYNMDYYPENTCDYLIMMFMTLDDKTWKLKMYNGYTEVDPDELHRAVEIRDNTPGMKVLLAVGGWDDGVAKYSDMMSQNSRRQAFIQSVVETLETYDFDGLELHWLYPGTAWRGAKGTDKGNYLQLVKELTRTFKPRRWLLTATVPPDQDAMNHGFNVRRLSSYLHQLHVRTFDLRGDWQGAAENHSPLFSRPDEAESLRHSNVNDSLTLWIKRGASPRKLVATFPFMGRSFTLRDPAKNVPGSPTSGPGRATPYVQAPGINAYYEICDQLVQNKMVRHFVPSTQTPYAVYDDQWVGYDDDVSLQKKVKFAKERDLAGVAIHAITLDDFTGKCGMEHILLRKTKQFITSNNF